MTLNGIFLSQAKETVKRFGTFKTNLAFFLGICGFEALSENEQLYFPIILFKKL